MSLNIAVELLRPSTDGFPEGLNLSAVDVWSQIILDHGGMSWVLYDV